MARSWWPTQQGELCSPCADIRLRTCRVVPGTRWVGGTAFAQHILPTITANGGQTRAGVRVAELLLDGDKAVGVTTSDGEEIRAEVVISTIGARETVNRLLPADCGNADWIAQIRSLPQSIAHFSLFMGFEGDIEDAGATRSNHWLYPTGEVDVLWTDAPQGEPPGMFVSFASLKDPSHKPGPEQKHAGEIMAWTDWSTVQRWANTAPMHAETTIRRSNSR
ncbi:MAG: FAD-dependent oxidoreductase [Burkholderiaceae bacterium]